LMVVALHPHAQQLLQRALHTEAFAREYLAVCDGCPPQSEGTVDLPIAKAEGATIRREISPDGQEAVTHYRVLERTKSRSLVWLRLETGRTHQIRVHMAALGCPVTGDFLYGREVAALPQRFALHSHRLCLNHPATGKRMEWVSPLPQTLRTLLDDSAELL
ncbi:MAG: RluA family pseudouridine synthase, partial [Clostridia bacterium]|nr:RluA family pseudouridine synthase [Clostridia bacterium]